MDDFGVGWTWLVAGEGGGAEAAEMAEDVGGEHSGGFRGGGG